ncbi:MAG: sulfate transporter family protein [Hyphomicrobiales bacterium]|nr:sulfate transporter family protein [Hyphomicrobiales bacterium]
MIAAAIAALNDVFSPPFRAVLWKSLGLTLVLLIGVWFGLQALLSLFVALPYPWLETTIAIVAGLGVFVGLIFLIAPVTALMAGLFQDEIAETVEQTHYPADRPGRALSLAESIPAALKFTALVIGVNLVALMLLLVPGINFAVFFIANGYLLGREFFEFAARRFHSPEEARRLRRAHRLTIWIAGLLIAGLLAIPLANLLTPLFATAFMIHLHKRLTAGRERVAGSR